MRLYRRCRNYVKYLRYRVYPHHEFPDPVCKTAGPRRAEDETTARIANFTLVGSALPHVLHTILFVTAHGMYDLRRPRTGAKCKYFSKCACATGSFIFPFKVRMRNRDLYFPDGCARAQQYFPRPVLDLVTSRPPHIGRKSYIPCACHENEIFMDFHSFFESRSKANA